MNFGTGRTFYVATNGSDSAAGTSAAPFRTILHGAKQCRPGDVLNIKGGNYYEKVVSTLTAGTSSEPILMRANPGEQPVLHGQMDLTGPSWWTFDGLDVRWQDPAHLLGLSKSNWMVRFANAAHWRLTNADIGYPESTAAVGIGPGCTDWRIDHNYVHHQGTWNNVQQDHLIYCQAPPGGNGIIERNLLAHSPNGRGIKIGEDGGALVGGVTIRYNTIYDNQGPTNINLSYGASNVDIYRNILGQHATSGCDFNPCPNVRPYNLAGTGSSAHDNLGWNPDDGSSSRIVAAVAGKLADGGGNVVVNPQFADLISFRPNNVAAQAYGRWAP